MSLYGSRLKRICVACGIIMSVVPVPAYSAFKALICAKRIVKPVACSLLSFTFRGAKFCVNHPMLAVATACTAGGGLFVWLKKRNDLLLSCISQNKYNCACLLRLLGAKINNRMAGIGMLFNNALASRNQVVIRQLVSCGLPLNTMLSDGQTALMRAALAGDQEMVNFLIGLGADVRRYDRNGQPVLFLPLSVAMIQHLISQGADINVLNVHGDSILINAIRNNYPQRVIEFLIATLAPSGMLNFQDVQGKTALMYAVELDQASTVALLMNVGVNRTIKDNKGKTVIDYVMNKERLPGKTFVSQATEYIKQRVVPETLLARAVSTGDIAYAQALIRGGFIQVDAPLDENGTTALMMAAAHSNRAMINMLLEYNARTDHITFDGRSVLHFVTDPWVANFLLDHGAPINVQKKHRKATPLMGAVINKNYAMVELLLSRGANPGILDENGCSPLHFVKDVALAQLLLAHGAPLNVASSIGITPLIQAVFDNNPELVELYIKNGVCKDMVDRDGRCAIGHANQIKDRLRMFAITDRCNINRIIRLLSMPTQIAQASVPVDPCVENLSENPEDIIGPELNDIAIGDMHSMTLLQALQDKKYDLVQSLMERGVQLTPELCTTHAESLGDIFVGAIRKTDSLCHALLDQAGFPVENWSADWRVYALHTACKAGNDYMVQRLIASGTDVNARDADNRTPLMLASMAGHVEVLRLLRGASANPNLVDDQSKMAIDFAQTADVRGLVQPLRYPQLLGVM